MAIPVRHGGLGIINPSHNNQIQHQSSEHITAPLISLILQQSHTYPQEAKAEQLRAKEQAVKLRKQRDATTATELKDKLPNNMKKAMEASTEKGASSWLATLPITEHGFALHKGDFRDALCLRYGWRPSHLPSHCICGQNFTVEHALICSRGGYPSIRHTQLDSLVKSVTMLEPNHHYSQSQVNSSHSGQPTQRTEPVWMWQQMTSGVETGDTHILT